MFALNTSPHSVRDVLGQRNRCFHGQNLGGSNFALEFLVSAKRYTLLFKRAKIVFRIDASQAELATSFRAAIIRLLAYLFIHKGVILHLWELVLVESNATFLLVSYKLMQSQSNDHSDHTTHENNSYVVRNKKNIR